MPTLDDPALVLKPVAQELEALWAFARVKPVYLQNIFKVYKRLGGGVGWVGGGGGLGAGVGWGWGWVGVGWGVGARIPPNWRDFLKLAVWVVLLGET